MFFLSFFTLLLSFYAWGPLVARADFHFSFDPSPIQQCQPVNVSFHGSQSKSFQSTKALTVLPFGAQPVSIPVDGTNVNSAGIALTFLPVLTGSQFIASLDDDQGDNSVKVSDVFHVVNDTGTDDCLPTPRDAPQPTPPIFAQTLPTSVTQCGVFTVTIEGGDTPNIRAMMPSGGAHMLTLVNNTDTQATYMVDLPHLTSLLLVAWTGDTTDITAGFTAQNLIIVGGDASSDTSCFKQAPKSSTSAGPFPSSTNAPAVPKGAIAGIIIGVVAILILLAALVLFLIRRRNIRKAQRHRALANSFNPQMLEKKKSSFSSSNYFGTPQQTFLAAEEGFIKNPPYTSDFNSRFSMASTALGSQTWATDKPLSPLRLGETGGSKLNRELSNKAVTRINAHDIEQMLNYTASATALPHYSAGASIANGYSQPYASSDAVVFATTPHSGALPTGASSSFPELNPFGDFGPTRESPLPISESGSMRTHRDSYASFPHGDPDALRCAVGDDSGGSDGEEFQIITVTRPQPAFTPTRNVGRLNSLPSSVKLASNSSFTSGQLVRVGSAGSSRNGATIPNSTT